MASPAEFSQVEATCSVGLPRQLLERKRHQQPYRAIAPFRRRLSWSSKVSNVSRRALCPQTPGIYLRHWQQPSAGLRFPGPTYPEGLTLPCSHGTRMPAGFRRAPLSPGIRLQASGQEQAFGLCWGNWKTAPICWTKEAPTAPRGAEAQRETKHLAGSPGSLEPHRGQDKESTLSPCWVCRPEWDRSLPGSLAHTWLHCPHPACPPWRLYENWDMNMDKPQRTMQCEVSLTGVLICQEWLLTPWAMPHTVLFPSPLGRA